MNKKRYLPKVSEIIYKNLIKKIFFQIDPETVHNAMVKLGEQFGKHKSIKKVFSSQFIIKDKSLKQNIAGIKFENPIGLAAGFDYEARLTQILPSLGFGFETLGTITDSPYGGNPRPMLGRLPKSKSLMVNKGFKNLGARITSEKLTGLSFEIPIGISIGKSNVPICNTQKKGIDDMINAFTVFENSKARHSYYELNISCPNLHGNVSFYPLNNLKELLTEIDKLHTKKPIFVKMPLEKSNNETLEILNTISGYCPKGIILSNLSKNRNNKLLKREEVDKFPAGIGSFSGKPTHKRSNELIKLAYNNFKQRFVIIGCGGVFNAQDAYEKIKHGASLVQLITGMIYEGPQIASQINLGLIGLLKKDGLRHISEAIGIEAK
ncbi:MAG: dihydroorotate dehydrogenase (quinone) [Candidatus Levybacteria bacterium RIFCSPLOWO2_12_FULL_37_14]|nr:MAG: dihydroorotate dehydrogenase 2, nonfunctional [Candidatus Levybacteria bacterium GW2011_GWA1_37_16]KKQ38719.1 MAG: dihydroorotate dehydrogenase 2, nonfunctional [Candidatus Levybacteria bacterium GW2011_GWC2_37_7]OGH51202.1 MAG: dihydroorotate dehydrogenase (quinone) [Candidatus Levybacteria bacterium RIFCSPLOWO2_12_FULL_37_14]